MPAEWVLDAGAAFEVNIRLKAFDRQGLLRDISDVIAKDKLDVLRVNTESQGEYAQHAAHRAHQGIAAAVAVAGAPAACAERD